MKTIYEVLDGIRLIKMYAWEKSFKGIVDKLRDNEMLNTFLKLFYEYVSKGFANGTPLTASFLTFVGIYYGSDKELTTAEIFSTIELLAYLYQAVILFVGWGIGFMFEF